MSAATRIIGKKRLVWRHRTELPYPFYRVVGKVAIQDVIRIARWRLDERRTFDQSRCKLVRVGVDESIKVLKAETGRPMIEWADLRTLFPFGRQMTLAEHSGAVAVFLQYFSNSGCRFGKHALIAVECARNGGCRTSELNGMWVSAGQQGRARGRADRRGVEIIKLQPILRKRVEGGSGYRTTESAGRSKTHVVRHDHENIWGTVGCFRLLRPDRWWKRAERRKYRRYLNRLVSAFLIRSVQRSGAG